MVVTVRIKRKGDAAALLRKVRASLLGPKHVKVGFPKGKADQDNINKAFWNEFGTAGGASGGGWGGPIPERPFMRTAVKDTKSKLKAVLPGQAAKILTGQTTMRQVLSKMGQQGVQDIRSTIYNGGFRGNSETTKRLKGSSRPLVDTGEMRGVVAWEIDE